MNKKSRHAIKDVLAKHYEEVVVTIVNTQEDLEALVERRPDMAFLGMKYVYSSQPGHEGTKIWLSGRLDQAGIAYTGSPQSASEMDKDKSLAKMCVTNAGLNTSKFIVAAKDKVLDLESLKGLEFPLFVKPNTGGGGNGIDIHSVVNNLAELNSKVGSIAERLDADSLVEEFLTGREFSVAVLKDIANGRHYLMPIEKIPPPDENGVRMLSHKVKTTDVAVDKLVDDDLLKSQLTTLAQNVFMALGARDFGRVDIRLDKDNTPHFLEANLIPSLIEGYGSFPKSCFMNNGFEFEFIILSIVELALARSQATTPELLEEDNTHGFGESILALP